MKFLRLLFLALALPALATDWVSQPYPNIKLTVRTNSVPRTYHAWIAEITLGSNTAVNTLPPASLVGGTWHTIKGMHLDYMTNSGNVLAVAACFYNYVDSNTNAELAGFSAFQGTVVSPFTVQPPVQFSTTFALQSYAIVDNAAAINFNPTNHAAVVTKGADSFHVSQAETIWTAVSGSCQTLSNGVDIISGLDYTGPPALTGNGTYNTGNRWYNTLQARSQLAINQAGDRLYLVVVDSQGGSGGMTVPEVVNNILLDTSLFPDPLDRPYNAINTDGGGSATMTLVDPILGLPVILNAQATRLDGSMLLIDYNPPAIPTTAPGGTNAVWTGSQRATGSMKWNQ